jgi:hypothetical protein
MSILVTQVIDGKAVVQPEHRLDVPSSEHPGTVGFQDHEFAGDVCGRLLPPGLEALGEFVGQLDGHVHHGVLTDRYFWLSG